MTLDEAIKHAREVAERIQKDANKQKGLNHGYYVWQYDGLREEVFGGAEEAWALP